MEENRLDGNVSAKAILEALKEEKVTSRCLANDLKQIFDDYFVGGSKMQKNGVIDVSLLNGQKFKIKVKEVR